MEDVFESELFKDFMSKILLHIKEKDSVKDGTLDTVLPSILRNMDQTNNAMKEVQPPPHRTPEDNIYQVY